MFKGDVKPFKITVSLIKNNDKTKSDSKLNIVNKIS